MDARSKLIEDARALLRDSEELIRSTAGDAAEKTREARARLAGASMVAKETCNRLERSTDERFNPSAQFIREHAVPAVGLAFGLGLLLGLLLGRR